ncbi:hypothetical protein JTB14_018486 [Gonioctena quinquepunctata]|nr:hypothetical protein JTB14_018486 [Gonioctena quinquepunctata]
MGRSCEYVLNRTISRQMNRTTLCENWFSRVPDIQNFFFLSVALLYNPKEVRYKKPQNDFGWVSNYRLWDQIKRKIYINANVRYEEADVPNQGSEESDIHLKLVFENEFDVLQPSIEEIESISCEGGENKDYEQETPI